MRVFSFFVTPRTRNFTKLKNLLILLLLLVLMRLMSVFPSWVGGDVVGHPDPVFSMHSIKAVCGFDALSFQVSCNNGSRKPVFSLGLMVDLLILAHGHLLLETFK